jgi:Tfp pilus assembly protein PilO
MYSKRNSLTILAVLVLLTSVGFFWYRQEAKALDEVARKNQQLTAQLRGALEVAETLSSVNTEYDSLGAKWQNAPKKLLNTEEPAFSLSYINWLIRVHNLDIDFDFYLNDRKARNELTAFSYTLNGEGDYRNISSLLWYITHNPILYQIKSVNFKRSEKDPDLLNFVIMFEGYSMNKSWEVGNEVSMVASDFNWEAEFAHDAFASLLAKAPEPKFVATAAPPKPKPEEPPNLIDVERASLMAITNEKAYLRAKDGRVVALRVGERVRHGSLTRLDQQRNQAEFQLESEAGDSRLVRLNIEYN